MSVWEYFRLYAFVIMIGLFVGVLHILRAIREEPIDTKSKAVQFVIYGVGSSMLVTWIGYEICVFYGLPPSLSCAVGGGLGFIGAETIARLLIRLFKKKTGLEDK